MEREILFTGIGGQSVQLGTTILAEAAVREGRHVMVLGEYGGSMRGGNTDATLVVGDAPIESPPRVSRAWSALAMHHQFWAPIASKLRPGAVVVVNASLFEAPVDGEQLRVFEVPATKLAGQLGNALVGSMVLVASYARMTGLVELESLIEAMNAALPPYRKQHAELNERALRCGWDFVPETVAPFWVPDGVTS
jgi:Pyruvate/2-oxoacid:ferredoxin oxidoreductase gamma subunit